MPTDSRNNNINKGYAFVAFTDQIAIATMIRGLDGVSWRSFSSTSSSQSKKVCQVILSETQNEKDVLGKDFLRFTLSMQN